MDYRWIMSSDDVRFGLVINEKHGFVTYPIGICGSLYKIEVYWYPTGNEARINLRIRIFFGRRCRKLSLFTESRFISKARLEWHVMRDLCGPWDYVKQMLRGERW